MSGTPGETLLVLVLTALLTVLSPLPLGAMAAAGGVAAAAVTAVAWTRRMPSASSIGLLFLTCFALSLMGIGPQQVVFALAFVVYFIVLSRVPWLRAAGRWLTAGRVDRTILAAGAAFAAVSGLALLAWHAAVQPNLGDIVRTYVPDWPLWLLAPAAFVLAVVNAAVEEAAYRGVVMDALDRTVGRGVVPVLLQAGAFATLHFQSGFPRGTIGVALAFVYGVALGLLRHHAGGLMAPFLTHVLTDLVIFAIVLTLA